MADLETHVRCHNTNCPDPADAIVSPQPIAPGVLGELRMLCAGCGFDVIAVARLLDGKLIDGPDAT